METRKSKDIAPKGEVRWIVPRIEAEKGEIIRTSEELGIEEEALFLACKNGRLELLSDADWENMDNCCSRDTSWKLEEAREHLAGTRDFSRIERGFAEGHDIPAPMVLFRKGMPPYLIAGNSRLLACRTLHQRPTILRVEME